MQLQKPKKQDSRLRLQKQNVFVLKLRPKLNDSDLKLRQQKPHALKQLD